MSKRNHFRTVLLCDVHQRGLLIIVLLVYISSSVDEQAHHFRTVLLCNVHQRGLLIIVLLVYISSSVDEQAHHFRTFFCATCISAVCPLLSCLFTSAPALMSKRIISGQFFLCDVHQRGLPVHVLFVNISFCINNAHQDRSVLTSFHYGVHQRSLTKIVMNVSIRSSSRVSE